MIEAQNSGKQAQRVINTVEDPIAQAADIEGLATLLADETLPIPERMLSALRARFPAISIPDMREHGVRIAEEQLGIRVGPNSGLSFLLLEPIAETTLHPDTFRAKIRLATSGAADIARLRAVAAMDSSVEALSETHRLIVEASIAFNAILTVETDERAVARRFGKLASEIYEASTPVLAWYQLLATDRDNADAFTRVAAQDATKLASELQKGSLAPVFDDAARYLRHAPVHGRALDYEPETGVFVISLKTHSEVVPRDVFMDRVFAFFETVLASIWSLENAIDLAEIDLNLSEADALYLGFTPLVLTTISLPAIANLEVREYAEVDRKWSFRVEGDADLLIPALAAAENAVGHVEQVLLMSSDESPLTVRLADSWAWTQAEGHDFAMNFLAFKASAERDGSSMLERSDVQFMLASLGVALFGGDVHTIVHLRRLKAWSKDRGWSGETKLADEIISTARGTVPADFRPRLAKLMKGLEQPQMCATRAVQVIVPSTH